MNPNDVVSYGQQGQQQKMNSRGFYVVVALVPCFRLRSIAVAADEIVYDDEGNPMETNGTYMLLATPQFGAGGIETVAISHDAIHAPCVLAVVEGESNNNSTGLPVTFTPCHDSKPTDYVTTSSCLHQQFHLGVLTGGSDAIGGSSFYIKPSKSAGAAKYTYWLNCDNHIFGYCDGVGVKKDKGLNRLFLLHGQYHDGLN